MKAEEMWNLYNKGEGVYQAWKFGVDPDVLAELVRTGQKRATASAYPVYEREKEPLPQAGEYNIILDSTENAVCITRTNKVSIVPFINVSEQHARLEGEGDLSLEYWRRVHRSFFTKELASHQLVFDENMLVVCEEFEVVYP